jgi:hypothetical protein
MRALGCIGIGLTALLGIHGARGESPPLPLLQPEFRLSNFHAPLVIDNPYTPMQPGTRTVFYELEDGQCKVNDVIVTHAAKRDFEGAYAGLAARVVRDRVWADDGCNGKRGLLLEDTTDWYGQDNGGNVWYFGENTVEYEYDDAGHRISASTEGSWEAGKRGAKAGILMFNRPVVGTYYLQEFEAGVAEDAAEIQYVDIRVETGLGRFHDCVKTLETTALSPGDIEYKYYCRNLGVVREVSPSVHGGAELVAFGLH